MSAASAALPYNRHMLIWAREQSGLDKETAARRAKVKPNRIVEWESGERIPTVKQARTLAAVYARPFLEFFAKEPPEIPVVDLAPDYRFYSDQPSKDELLGLTEVQRWAEERRLNALDLFELIGEEPPVVPTALYASLTDSVDQAASNARKEIDLSIEAQTSMKSNERSDLPKILRQRFEQIGILVLKLAGLRNFRARGICLYADPLPVIVYGNEAPGAQAFTLAHELAHILLKKSAISGPPISFLSKGAKTKRIEDWCNKFAAAFLIPADSVERFLKRPDEPSETIGDTELERLSKRYAVSNHAMLIRLVNLGYVRSDYYWKVKRPSFLLQEAEKYESFGRSEYYGVRYVNSNGNLYTSLVLEAWDSGQITNHNAAEFMGIKNLAHFEDIQQRFGR